MTEKNRRDKKVKLIFHRNKICTTQPIQKIYNIALTQIKSILIYIKSLILPKYNT